ncbi:hypothetical protein [Sphingopyxis sp. PET50]|uniref:hypothetical protein n=1 Tax=Sphingopyxis sp. PET50 TaxID=2976533 RepID=UPI0021AE4CD7|nr:hypothetical protein [Sphingopyxis sp. PET50]
MIRTIFAAVGALTLFAGTQVAAFEPLPDGTTAEERANTARLNAEQRARAEAENAAYQKRLAAFEAQKASAESKFISETAAYEAEKARIATMSAEERIQWEADAAACKAGDVARCAKPETPPQP